jgi:hypothetical protein
VELLSSRLTPVSTVTRLRVDYAPGAPASAPTSLFLKTPRPDLPREVTIQLGEREVRFYRDLAPAMPGSPLIRCYSATSHASSAGWHLLLDDLTDTHATPASRLLPTLDVCKAAVGALAAVHAHWWAKEPSPAEGADRDQPNEPPPDQWQRQRRQAVAAFVAFLGDRLSAHRRQTYAAVVAGLPGLRRRRAIAGPTTVVHGDAHLGNFLFPRASAAGPVYPCDWQDWWIGEPTRDIAYLVGKSWDPTRRADAERTLLRHYHARLEAGGVEAYPWEQCWDDYRYSMINLLFVPMGQWEIGLGADIWGHHLDWGMSAFDDLGCADLLAR